MTDEQIRQGVAQINVLSRESAAKVADAPQAIDFARWNSAVNPFGESFRIRISTWNCGCDIRDHSPGYCPLETGMVSVPEGDKTPAWGIEGETQPEVVAVRDPHNPTPSSLPQLRDMIQAGAQRLRELDDGYTHEFRAAEVYEVMRALAPALSTAELLVPYEKRLAAMMAERDDALVKWQAARDALIGENVLLDEMAALRQRLADRDVSLLRATGKR